jgi:hypothetical protein
MYSSARVRCTMCPASATVTKRQSGMSAAASASLSWGTWLVDPPPMIKVGAEMRDNSPHQAGSGRRSWAMMDSYIASREGAIRD